MQISAANCDSKVFGCGTENPLLTFDELCEERLAHIRQAPKELVETGWVTAIRRNFLILPYHSGIQAPVARISYNHLFGPYPSLSERNLFVFNQQRTFLTLQLIAPRSVFLNPPVLAPAFWCRQEGKLANRACLIDEVDVLFARRFYGNTWDGGFKLTSPKA